MARVERILERFRTASAPGTAAAAGVPADRVAELAAELEPVLARLAPVQQQCEEIRSAALTEAARRVPRGALRAPRGVPRAPRDVPRPYPRARHRPRLTVPPVSAARSVR